MERRYEFLILTVPEITQDETASLEKDLDGLARSAKGATISFERWGKYRLCYPVRKNDYGVYFLARFSVPTGTKLLDSIRDFFTIRMNDVVMRHSLARLEADASLEYQRPRSLEESPASRDVSSFLRENKMEGLLATASKQDSSEEASDVLLDEDAGQDDQDELSAGNDEQAEG